MICLKNLPAVCILISVVTMESQSYNGMLLLRTHLMQNYSRDFRPLKNQSQTLELRCRPLVKTVKDFDHSKGVLTTIVMMIMYWKDEFIQWHPYDYEGIEHIHFPIKDVWMPNIVLANPAAEYNILDTDIEGLSVFYTFDGNASLMYGGLMKTTCLPFVKYFPFDSQNCQILLTNIRQKENVRLEPYAVSLESEYVDENGQWYVTLGNVSANKDRDLLEINIQLTRRPVFLLVMLFIPVGMLLLMNIFVFTLPVESGEKATYSITILLSLTIFITIMMSEMPSVSTEIPIVSYFLLMHLLNNVFICVNTITSIEYFYKDEALPIPFHYRLMVMITNCKIYGKRQKETKVEDISSVNETQRPLSSCENELKNPTWITWKRVSRSIDHVHFIFTIIFVIVEMLIVFYYSVFD